MMTMDYLFDNKDYQALFRFVLIHGRNSLKEKDIIDQGGAIADTYIDQFKNKKLENPLDTVFNEASKALNDDTVKKKYGIKAL